MNTAGNERLHSQHPAGNRKGSCEGGLRATPKVVVPLFVRYSQVSSFSGKSGLYTGRTKAVRARYAASTCSSSPGFFCAVFPGGPGHFLSRSSIPGFSDCPRVARTNLKSLTWWGIDLVTSSPVPLRVLARQGYTISRRPVWAALRTRARGPRMHRGIQGLIKSTPVKVYSSLDDVGLEDQLKACPLLKAQPTRQESLEGWPAPKRIENRKSPDSRGSEIWVCTHTTPRWIQDTSTMFPLVVRSVRRSCSRVRPSRGVRSGEGSEKVVRGLSHMKKRSKEGGGKGTKESETPETSSQTQIQSTWPGQCGRASEGFWQSRATHLTQWPMPERHESRFSRRLQAQRDLRRKRSLFNPQGCETLKEFRV